jgi:hypothetical protein
MFRILDSDLRILIMDGDLGEEEESLFLLLLLMMTGEREIVYLFTSCQAFADWQPDEL